ncbi:STAS-like domain-containing protein [Sphingobium xanthum]|nr:STAS-like domain-containing protein [Sphingobium xanthum]
MISIAQDFSRSPAGRFISDGPNSGERFREKFLVPHLEKSRQITVELDGTRGMGSSFLEEAFGGLIRRGYSPEFLKDHIILESRDRSLQTEIQGYWFKR